MRTGIPFFAVTLLVMGPSGVPAAEPNLPDTEFATGSRIALSGLDERQLDALVLTVKTWGFLKYHHPALTSGQRHWDFELFRHLPPILAARDRAGVESALVAWIDSLGPLTPCRNCLNPDDTWALRPRLAWMEAGTVGAALRQRLRDVHGARVPNQQFFVRFVPGVGNAVFDKEPRYPGIKLPDAGYAILSVARIWNMVEYWFPYRELIDENWDAVLRDSLPRTVAARSAAEFELEMAALVARIDDGHANLFSASGRRPPAGDCQIPVGVRVVEGEFVVRRTIGGSEDARKFRAGDVFVSIDGRPIAELVEEARPYYGASNEGARLRDIAHALTRGRCGPVKVGMRRDAPLLIDAQRVSMNSLDVASAYANDRPGATLQKLSAEAAYLRISTLKLADVQKVMGEAADAKWLVIDNRGYPAEFTLHALGGMFVDKATRFSRFAYPDITNPGAFLWTQPMPLMPAQPRFRGRIAILVDAGTQSSGEYTTMALQVSPGAIVVGSQTAGADGNLSPIPLPAGMRAGMSGIGAFYPDKTPTQQVGVKLDVPCTPTIAGIRAGRDEVLDCALKALGASTP